MTDIALLLVTLPAAKLHAVMLPGARRTNTRHEETVPYVSVSPSVVWLTPANGNMAEVSVRSNTDWKAD